jgi:hypothetical protein
MDMLEVGRGMSQEEDHTHFAVWCMMSSPLLIGCDLTNLKPETWNLLTDSQLIAINQDPLGLQAYVVKHDVRQGTYVLVKDLQQRQGLTRIVALYNPTDTAKTVQVGFADLELDDVITVRNLYAQTDVKLPKNATGISEQVPAHGCRLYRLTASNRLQRRLYEAETAYLSSYQEIKNNQAFLTAIYEEDGLCSGGVKASRLGGRADNDLRWRDVYVQKTGRYALRIAALTDTPRTLHVSVNGIEVGTLSYNDNGEQTVFVSLQKGRNEVRLWNDKDRMPDVDYMMVDNAPNK